MDSQFIQIEKDKVVKRFENGTSEEKQLLTDFFPALFTKSAIERLFNFEDVCREAGCHPGDYELKSDMTADEKNDLYYQKMRLIYKMFNGDWIPDFSNEDQPKYYPWFEYKKGTGFVLLNVSNFYDFTIVGSRLCSHSEKIVRHVCKHFLKEYNDYLLS